MALLHLLHGSQNAEERTKYSPMHKECVFGLCTELYISCTLYIEQSDCSSICIQRAGNRLPTTFSGYQQNKQT